MSLKAKFIHRLAAFVLIVLFSNIFFETPKCFAESAARCNLVNLMPEFWTYCTEATTLQLNERVQLIKKDLIEPHQSVFDAALKSSMGQLKDASIAKYLSIVHEKIPSIRTTSDEFPVALAQSCEAFGKTFPDMKWKWNAYLMPSFYTFDGMSSEVENESAILFGADVLADSYRNLSGLDFKTFLSHELFHIYHRQIAPETFDEYMGAMHTYRPLYICLWTEGLACYASQVLNPSSSLADVVLDKTLAQEGPKSIRETAGQFAGVFASTSPAEHARFFAAGAKGSIPARSGYYLGLIVAQRLSKEYPLDKLVRLNNRDLENEVTNALEEIAAGRVIK